MNKTPPLWISFAYSTGGTLALIPSFLIWATLLAAHKLKELDSRISDWCHRPEQRKAWILFSRLGDGWLYAAYFFWMRESETPGANRLAAALLIAWGLGSALKIIVRRKRQNPIRRRHKILQTMGSWTFPSQHAAVSIAFAYALWPNPFAAGLALLVCCSRVLVGAHYLGDVLAGVVVGLVAGRLA
jgi:membrane-associated phospholipid phosphatase